MDENVFDEFKKRFGQTNAQTQVFQNTDAENATNAGEIRKILYLTLGKHLGSIISKKAHSEVSSIIKAYVMFETGKKEKEKANALRERDMWEQKYKKLVKSKHCMTCGKFK